MTAEDAMVAAQMYDKVAKADLPQQLVLTATRGAILARGPAGVPLLVEQLQSTDKHRFNLGLSLVARFPAAKPQRRLLPRLAAPRPRSRRC